MVDYRHIAIADVLKHPVFGVVSHQPDLRKPVSDVIIVRDVRGRSYSVLASDCTEPTEEEALSYWREFRMAEDVDEG